jgi:hypothetical protein
MVSVKRIPEHVAALTQLISTSWWKSITLSSVLPRPVPAMAGLWRGSFCETQEHAFTAPVDLVATASPPGVSLCAAAASEMFHLLPGNIGAGEFAILCLLTQRFGAEFCTNA